jgi:hypothetical protein
VKVDAVGGCVSGYPVTESESESESESGLWIVDCGLWIVSCVLLLCYIGIHTALYSIYHKERDSDSGSEMA